MIWLLINVANMTFRCPLFNFSMSNLNLQLWLTGYFFSQFFMIYQLDVNISTWVKAATVFSQDCHDTMLEVERMKELNAKALLIQKVMRGYKYRYGTHSFTSICLFIYLFSAHVTYDFMSVWFMPSKGNSSWGKGPALLLFRNTGEDTKEESCTDWWVTF